MNISAELRGLDEITSGIKKFGEAVAAPAVQAAADALTTTIKETRRANSLAAPLVRQGEGPRRTIGASDAVSIAAEFGALERDATPWLAPSLPAAKSPMRAAVVTAVARALSALRLNTR